MVSYVYVKRENVDIVIPQSVDNPDGRNHRFHRGHGNDNLEKLPVSEGRSQMRNPQRSPPNTAPVVSCRADTPAHSPAPARRNTSARETAIRNFLRGAEVTRDEMKLDSIWLQGLLRDLLRDARDYRSQK